MSEEYTNVKEMKIKREKLDLDTHSQEIAKCQNTPEKKISPIHLRSKSLDNCGKLISQNILNKSLPSNIKIIIPGEENLGLLEHIKEEQLSPQNIENLHENNERQTDSPLDPNFLYLEAAYLNLRRSSVNSSSNKGDLDPCSSVTDETVTAEKISPFILEQCSKNEENQIYPPNVNETESKRQENESTSQSTQEYTKAHFISMSQIENSQEPVISLTEIDPLAHPQPCKDDSITINIEGGIKPNVILVMNPNLLNMPKMKLQIQPLKGQSALNISQNVSVENITNMIPALKNDSQNAQLIKNMNTSLSNNEDTLRPTINDTANTKQNKLIDHGIKDESKEQTESFQVKNTDISEDAAIKEKLSADKMVPADVEEIINCDNKNISNKIINSNQNNETKVISQVDKTVSFLGDNNSERTALDNDVSSNYNSKSCNSIVTALDIENDKINTATSNINNLCVLGELKNLSEDPSESVVNKELNIVKHILCEDELNSKNTYSEEPSCVDDVKRQTKLIINKDKDATTDMLQPKAAIVDVVTNNGDKGNTTVTSDNIFPSLHYVSMSQIQNTQQDLSFMNAMDPLTTTNMHHTKPAIVDVVTNNNDESNITVTSDNIIPALNYISMSQIQNTQQDLSFINAIDPLSSTNVLQTTVAVVNATNNNDVGNITVTSDNIIPALNYISMSQIQNTQQDLSFINAIDPLSSTNVHQTTVAVVNATNNNDVGNISVTSDNILPGINYISMSQVQDTQQDLSFINSVDPLATTDVHQTTTVTDGNNEVGSTVVVNDKIISNINYESMSQIHSTQQDLNFTNCDTVLTKTNMQRNRNEDSVPSTITNNIKNITVNETYDDRLSDKQDQVGMDCLSTLQDNNPILNIDQKNKAEEISRPLIDSENVSNSNFNEDEYEECIADEENLPFQHLPFFNEDEKIKREPINTITDSTNVETSKLSHSSPSKVCENEQSVETDNLTQSFYSAQSTQDKVNDEDQQKCIIKDISNVTDKYLKLTNITEPVSVSDNSLLNISADDTTQNHCRIRCRSEEDTEDIPFPKKAKLDVCTELTENLSPDRLTKESRQKECSDSGDVELDVANMELPLEKEKNDSNSSADLTTIADNIEQEAVDEPWWIMKTLSQGFDEDYLEFINFSPHIRKPSLVDNTTGESKVSEERSKSSPFYLQLGDLAYISNQNNASRNVRYQIYGETFDTVIFYGIIVDVRKMKDNRYIYVVDDGTGSVQVRFNHSSKQQKKHLSIINYLEQQLQLAEQFGLPNMLPDSKTGPRAEKLIQEMKQLYQPLRNRILSPMTPLERGNRAYVVGKLFFCPREEKLQVVGFNLEIDETAGTGEIAWKRFLIKIYEEYYYKRTRQGNLITTDKTKDCKTN